MGKSSFDFGDLFETVFQRTCKSKGLAVTRIPDSCKQLKDSIIRVKSPFDWIVTYNHQTALIDTKTVQGDSFNHSAINQNQVAHLIDHESFGAIAGYVIWLRKTHKVFFIPASALLRCIVSGRGSFDETHPYAVFLGEETFDVKRIFPGGH